MVFVISCHLNRMVVHVFQYDDNFSLGEEEYIVVYLNG
jgi:hypothetical protein